VTGLPVDPAGFGGYHGGPVEGPVAPPPERRYRPEPVPQSPYPELSTSMLLRPVKPPPSEGWRRLLYVASGQLINVGESPRAARYNDLVAQVNRPLRGSYRIAVVSLKGGVGKTTISATLGAISPTVRGDRVGGGGRQPRPRHAESEGSAGDAGHGASAAAGGGKRRALQRCPPLHLAGPERAGSAGLRFRSGGIGRVQRRRLHPHLGHPAAYYGLVLTDCGTGMLHSAMSAVLAKADVLIIVSSGSVDGARSASATLDWLDVHGHEDLVRNSIAVINGVRPQSGKVDMHKLVDHFSRRCRAVRLVPFDPHLEEGVEIDLDRLKRGTRESLTELAAVVADGFPSDQRPSNRASASAGLSRIIGGRVLAATGTLDRHRVR